MIKPQMILKDRLYFLHIPKHRKKEVYGFLLTYEPPSNKPPKDFLQKSLKVIESLTSDEVLKKSFLSDVKDHKRVLVDVEELVREPLYYKKSLSNEEKRFLLLEKRAKRRNLKQDLKKSWKGLLCW